MSYPRSQERIVALLPAVLAMPEIADELEKKAIRRDVIEQETIARSTKIWEAVSARAEAYELTEQTIASLQQRMFIPVLPPYLRRIRKVGWTMLWLVVVSGAAIVASRLLLGSWDRVLLYELLSWRNWALLGANLLVVSGVLLAWHRYRNRYFKVLIRSANDEFEVHLRPLKQQLEAEKRLADESLEQAVISEVREIISQKKASWFGTSLPDSNPDGLSQVQNIEFEITTAAGDRLRRIMCAVNGASIGISGPRGAGKDHTPMVELSSRQYKAKRSVGVHVCSRRI
jgi:hypothetical protein